MISTTDSHDNLIPDTPELKLPHPLMQERDFVMRPLVEIVHPVFNKYYAGVAIQRYLYQFADQLI